MGRKRTLFEEVGDLVLAELAHVVDVAIVAQEGEHVVGEHVGIGIGPVVAAGRKVSARGGHLGAGGQAGQGRREEQEPTYSQGAGRSSFSGTGRPPLGTASLLGRLVVWYFHGVPGAERAVGCLWWLWMVVVEKGNNIY